MTYHRTYEKFLHTRHLLRRDAHHLLLARLIREAFIAQKSRFVLPAASDELVHSVDERRLIDAERHGTVVYVSVAEYLVGHERYAFHHRVDGFRAFERVGLAVEHKLRLEADEVCLVLLDVVSEV